MNIYVGNLSRDVSEEDLRQAFEAFGQIATATIIKDKFSGESRGFGFVEMPSKTEAQSAMQQIMMGEATDAQIAAYITALRIRGETAEVITGSARAMRQRCTPVHVSENIVVDTCGTGGDGSHTINISTAAAFVAAGAGVTVAKHGNRSISSRCGSADVLESLGVKIEIPLDAIVACLKENIQSMEKRCYDAMNDLNLLM